VRTRNDTIDSSDFVEDVLPSFLGLEEGLCDREFGIEGVALGDRNPAVGAVCVAPKSAIN
jgi:hypothetical protein